MSRLDYTEIEAEAGPVDADWDGTIDRLVTSWRAAYVAQVPGADIVFVDDGPATYMFDIGMDRLIAAWAVSAGRDPHARDKYRQQKSLIGLSPDYHRGHAIPHRMGGGMDINIVPQLARTNLDETFRLQETNAIALPGSLYFTHWNYGKGDSQVPISVDQGLLKPGQRTSIINSPN